MRGSKVAQTKSPLNQSAIKPQKKLSTEEGIKKYGLRALKIWAFIGAVIILMGVGFLLGKITVAIQILIISFVITFLSLPLVGKLEEKGLNRALGTLVAYLIAILLLSILFSLVIPVISEQVSGLIKSIPGYVSQAQAWADTMYDRYAQVFADSQVQEALRKGINSISSAALKFANTSASGIITAGSSIVSSVAVIFMSLVVAFWLTMDFPKFQREAMIIVGPSKAEEYEIMTAVFSRAMGGYIKGLIITSTCTGIIAGIGFFIIGVPYAGLLGLATGILNVIPIVGPWVGGGLAALVSLFVSPWTAVLSVVITVAAQQLTDTFISPKVMQSAVAVHPMLVILGLSVGGSIGGVAGMIFAVPLIAAFKGVFTYYFEMRTGRQLISEDGAVFRGEPFNDEDGNPIPAYDATGGSKYYAAKFVNPLRKKSIDHAREVEKKRKQADEEEDSLVDKVVGAATDIVSSDDESDEKSADKSSDKEQNQNKHDK